MLIEKIRKRLKLLVRFRVTGVEPQLKDPNNRESLEAIKGERLTHLNYRFLPHTFKNINEEQIQRFIFNAIVAYDNWGNPIFEGNFKKINPWFPNEVDMQELKQIADQAYATDNLPRIKDKLLVHLHKEMNRQLKRFCLLYVRRVCTPRTYLNNNFDIEIMQYTIVDLFKDEPFDLQKLPAKGWIPKHLYDPEVTLPSSFS